LLAKLENVTHALLGMYPEQHAVHEWLVEKAKEWNALAKAIYDVGCVLKSQKKRLPTECNNKLFVLWCQWNRAFPGMKSNKYHGMLCAIRRFVHKYEMVGKISEESNNAFNTAIAEVKK